MGADYSTKCSKCKRRWPKRPGLCSSCRGVKPVDVYRKPLAEIRVIDYDNKKIGKNVTGRDLVQPYNKDGSKNQGFMDRYGDGIYEGKPSQLDGKGKEVKRTPQDKIDAQKGHKFE